MLGLGERIHKRRGWRPDLRSSAAEWSEHPGGPLVGAPAEAGATGGVGVSNNSRTCPFAGLARWYSYPLRWKNRGYETLQLQTDGLHTFAASTRSDRVRTLAR
jgi:hypothetical protein